MNSLDTRLVLAAGKGDLEAVKGLVEQGADLSYPNQAISL